MLVDELAHTNAPGSRHAKRWQDVVELLDAGIDVYTTVNVQHVESLNDVVAKITGVVMRETVPDSVFEQADEVELIDLPPDDLLERFREGKVYLPGQAQEALENFFRKGNLIALRELALRRTAERVDAQMRVYRREHAIERIWPTVERILVCVGPSPMSTRLVRAAKRMADQLGAEWIAAYVETPAQLRLPAEARDSVIQTLRLAEQLGAQTIRLSGQTMSEALLAYAHDRNVTRLIVGKPSRTRWQRIFLGSIVDTLVQGSGDIDVHVIGGEREEGAAAPVPPRRPLADRLAGVPAGRRRRRSGDRGRLRALPLLRAVESGDGVSPGDRDRRHAHRPGSVAARRRCSASPRSTSSSSRPASPSPSPTPATSSPSW